jgi:NDP-sugar pyrophosphorylase family protein
MRGMILAAGFGTRLWPLTADRTKPALPILGQPLIGFVAEYLAGFGVRDLAVNLHHEPDSVRKALGDGSRFGVHLTYVEEAEILGTSGALDNAREFFQDEAFVVINGKIVTDIDLRLALETHRRTNAIATLVLKENSGRERFSEVLTSGERITGFGGMPASDNDRNSLPLMFTGIQILEPRIFSYIPRGRFSHSTVDVYPQAIAAGEVVAAHLAEGMWHELSTIPRYLDISLELMKARGERVNLGRGCEVAKGAEVDSAVLWDRVRIEEGARVTRCVLADGVVIGRGEHVENAAVVRRDVIFGQEAPSKALKGEFRGENFVVPLTQ